MYANQPNTAMSKKILVTGGRLRPNGFTLGEGKYYGCAVLLRLDTVTGSVESLLVVDEGNENFPVVHPNLEFTVGTVDGGDLWLTTDTEVRRYSYPDMALMCTHSHPCFHNNHSVAVRGDHLYVTSTGLDMVVVLNKHDGSIIEQINCEGKPTWHRFSPDDDYRKLHSTRPHDCHPNYVFWVDDQPWVTRCTQEDAVALRDVERRIDISREKRPISIHDGVTRGDKIYFTLVDGTLVIADANSLELVASIEIFRLEGYEGVRGWCRGIHLDDNIAYVGFSRLRPTKRLDKIAWVRALLNRGPMIEDCSILAIDLERRQIVADYRFPAGTIDAIYTILPEPRSHV